GTSSYPVRPPIGAFHAPRVTPGNTRVHPPHFTRQRGLRKAVLRALTAYLESRAGDQKPSKLPRGGLGYAAGIREPPTGTQVGFLVSGACSPPLRRRRAAEASPAPRPYPPRA